MENELLIVDRWVAYSIVGDAQSAYGDVENARRTLETLSLGNWTGAAAEGAWEMLSSCYRESLTLSDIASQALYYSQEGAQL